MANSTKAVWAYKPLERRSNLLQNSEITSALQGALGPVLPLFLHDPV